MKKLLFCISFLLCLSISAQDFRGVIKTEITYEDISIELKPYLSTFPSLSTSYIRDKKAKTVTSTSTGEIIILTDMVTNDIIQLINQMGSKIAIRMNIEEQIKENELPEIEFSDETEEILGYECKKAMYEVEGNEYIIYYTEELPNLTSEYSLSQIKGYPMKIITISENLTTIATVTEISEERVKKIKMKIPADYEEMTLEEIKEMQQKASGM